MTDQPKLWREMSDAEKGALLLAHHQGEAIQLRHKGGGWFEVEEPAFASTLAYRVKPKAPKVETVRDERHIWSDAEGLTWADRFLPKPATIEHGRVTHTYTITDGRMTACDTIIHD